MFSPSCAFASKGAFTTIGCFRAAFRLALNDFGCCNVLIGDLSKHFWHKIKNHTYILQGDFITFVQGVRNSMQAFCSRAKMR